jgi:hypothetical protein
VRGNVVKDAFGRRTMGIDMDDSRI